MTDVSAANTNLVESVVINIKAIIGRTTIDNYFHYDVSVFINFSTCISSINLGIHDRA